MESGNDQVVATTLLICLDPESLTAKIQPAVLTAAAETF